MCTFCEKQIPTPANFLTVTCPSCGTSTDVTAERVSLCESCLRMVPESEICCTYASNDDGTHEGVTCVGCCNCSEAVKHQQAQVDWTARRKLAVAWTRAGREMCKALAEFERCSDDPPDFPPMPNLEGTLDALLTYRDRLRNWADLPPGDNAADTTDMTPEQAELAGKLEDMEDNLNETGHSMTTKRERGQ
jgi:hypothetical protein